jgi:hypothetical protein
MALACDDDMGIFVVPRWMERPCWNDDAGMEEKLIKIHLGLCVPARGFGRALDIHAVAAGVVELGQLHEIEHLQK